MNLTNVRCYEFEDKYHYFRSDEHADRFRYWNYDVKFIRAKELKITNKDDIYKFNFHFEKYPKFPDNRIEITKVADSIVIWFSEKTRLYEFMKDAIDDKFVFRIDDVIELIQAELK